MTLEGNKSYVEQDARIADIECIRKIVPKLELSCEDLEFVE